MKVVANIAGAVVYTIVRIVLVVVLACAVLGFLVMATLNYTSVDADVFIDKNPVERDYTVVRSTELDQTGLFRVVVVNKDDKSSTTVLSSRVFQRGASVDLVDVAIDGWPTNLSFQAVDLSP